jgi:hypothetical protein
MALAELSLGSNSPGQPNIPSSDLPISQGTADESALTISQGTTQEAARNISQGNHHDPSLTISKRNPHGTTSTSSLDQPHLADNDDAEGLRGMMGADVEIDQSLRQEKYKLTDAQMEQFAIMDLEGLRTSSKAYSNRRRMTEDMQEELDEMYHEFQCNVARLAIQNRVGAHLYFEHLGQSRRIRKSTSWNNYQQYDPEAQKIFDECT